MYSLFRPTALEINRFVAERAEAPFSYSEVGMTRGAPPRGYGVNAHRIRLGTGAADFAAACGVMRRWAMFDLPWVSVCDVAAAIEPGVVVGILVRRCGLWSLNACRILETIDEDGAVARFGFRYGTLAEHVERGEEEFVIEWDRADDSVWYGLKAYSRPGHWTARWGRPIVRRFQHQFGVGSTAAMRRAVRADDGPAG